MRNFTKAAVIIAVASLFAIGFVLTKDNSVEDTLSKVAEMKANIFASIDKDDEKMMMTATVSSKLNTSQLPDNPNNDLIFDVNNLRDIYLAGGCFWGLEAYMTRVYGVYDVTSGYANGSTSNPTYEEVIYNNTGHAETVHVQYDPLHVNLETLLAYYLKVVDPTSLNKQGNDKGTQYRTGIYYKHEEDLLSINTILAEEQIMYNDEIVIEAIPLDLFFPAEDYHQDYLEKNPNGYCHIDLKDVEEDLSVYTKPSDKEIKEMLTPLQYEVTQNEGTERSFDNEYWDNTEEGLYVDIITGQPLFSSRDKYKSGTGWPSFTKPISATIVKEVLDKRLGVDRIEVRSILGDSHLGHVFTDGPKDRGGLRYCLNSASLKFIPRDSMDEMGYSHLNYLFE